MTFLRHRRMRAASLAACAALLLGACAAPPPAAPPQAGPVDAQTLSRTGRFALHAEEVGAQPQAVQGGFAWRDDGRNASLDLNSPLGDTLARVEVQPGGAVLRESNGKQTVAADPDALVHMALGVRIPVSGLRDWLRGKVPPAPAATVTQRDAQQRPTEFEQDGWRVRAQQYDAVGPTRLLMNRADPDGRTVDLRLAVDAP